MHRENGRVGPMETLTGVREAEAPPKLPGLTR
jgi:hypothetical protein